MTTPFRIKYQTIEIGLVDIHLCTLRDKQQFWDPSNVAKDIGINDTLWSLFGVIWPSSKVLAHYLDTYETRSKRILEVGCGMALSSLLLNKQHADITATDYHPEVGLFLKRNTTLNDDDDIPFERVDWTCVDDGLGQFDLILGSDILYEDAHIQQLASFIDRHSHPSCEIILVDPNRGRKNKFNKMMEQYGYKCHEQKIENPSYLDEPFKGHILKYGRKI